ncbi:hypothetical protein Zmor_006259 [Zophobas morio]|uniref:Uncharacterized protein n=1 Tax=Zophobas morio TaxID=2755281 RepID=A0AA38MMP2_9CUCU|nr:hypothetical protein Zmor_006259 [Zophobas morio]
MATTVSLRLEGTMISDVNVRAHGMEIAPFGKRSIQNLRAKLEFPSASPYNIKMSTRSEFVKFTIVKDLFELAISTKGNLEDLQYLRKLLWI